MVEFVKPKIDVINRPNFDQEFYEEFLREEYIENEEELLSWVGYRNGTTDDGMALVEFAGRVCYDSFPNSGNPNISRIRTDPHAYIQNIAASKHGSVMEHAVYSFLFRDVSRIFTHELVRHRAGASPSQESGRYVRPTELRIVDVTGEEANYSLFYENLWDLYKSRELSYGWADNDFSQKKKDTSAARRMLPEGRATRMVWTANVRAIRHAISLRTSPGAEVEIRYVFAELAEKMKKEFPAAFSDMEYVKSVDSIPVYAFKNEKV